MNKKLLHLSRWLFTIITLLTISVGNVWGAIPSGWTQVTTLNGMSAGDKIIIVTNDGNNYLNGSVSKGHFSSTALSASAPANASAAGVIELESTGTANTYKLKLASTSKYVTASAAKSGSGVNNADSDDSGWAFTVSDGTFDAQYQESGKMACLRSYNNNDFRTYANTSSGNAFKIYKYSSAPSYTITAQSNNNTYGTVSLSGSIITGAPTNGYRYANPAYTVSPANSATVAQNGNEFTVNPSENTTVTINFEVIPSHTVTWSANGNTSNTSSVKEGDAIEFPNTATGCTGGTFVGWTASPIDGTSDEAPTYVTSAIMSTSDITYYAVFADEEEGGDAEWVETALSDLTSSDVFVLSTGSYALNNDNGTSSAPSANSITVSNGKITSTVADKLKWNISGNATDGYVFYPNGSTTTWLYCNTTASSSSNNNIRVGSGDRKLWKPNNSGYLVTNDNNTARYLSLFDNSDFRGYTGTNNGAFVPKCYKSVVGVTYSNYRTTCCTSLGSINGSISSTQPEDYAKKTVEWTIPVDDNSQKKAAGVIVKLYTDNSDAKGTEIIAKQADYSSDNNTTSHTFEGLDPSTKYWFTVTLIGGTASGVTYCDSEEGDAVSFTTDAASNSWTITYNANADDVTNMPTETYADKTTGEGTLSSTIPVRAGYTFLGWDEADDAESATYEAGDAITGVNDDTDLYAIWKRRDVTLTAGSGSVTSSTLVPDAEGKVTLPSATLPATCTEIGWEFVGWAEAEVTGDKPETIIPAGEYTPAAEITLYAVYGELGNVYTKTTTLTSGNYVFATATGNALNNVLNDANKAEGKTVTITNNTTISTTSSDADIIWQVTKSSDNYTLYNAAVEKYLNIVPNTDDNFGHFGLEESSRNYTVDMSNGDIRLWAPGKTVNQVIEYYNAFTCYGSVNANALIYAFKQDYDSYQTSPNCTAYTLSSAVDPAAKGEVVLGKTSLLPNGQTTAEATPIEGYRFLHWTISGTGASMSNTSEGKSTDNPVTVTMGSANATITAHFDQIPTHDVTFSVNGSVDADLTLTLSEGASIPFPKESDVTLPNYTNKRFVGWIESPTIANPAVAPSFVTSAVVGNADKTYYAVMADVTEGDYEKLTSATGLTAGDKLVATDGEAVGMKAYDSGNNCKGTAITIEADRITERGEAAELLLGGESGHWTLFDGENYLYAAGTAGSGTNYMKGKTPKDNACEWTISISSGDATIQSVTNSQTPYMRYNPNNNSPIFSCYNSNTGQNQAAVVLFKKAVTVSDFVTTVAPLDHITISGTFPTTYKKGTTLNLSDMVVTATYGTGGDARDRVLASNAYTVDLAGTELATTDEEFVVSFGGETATQAIHVYALSGIEITSAPTKTTYKAGETFVPEGLKIQATWGGDATDKIVESNIATGFTYSPTTAFENETDENINVDVTITYEDAEVAQSATQQVTVEPLAHLVMTWNVAGETTTSKIYINGDEQYLLALPEEDPEVPEAFGAGYAFIGWTSDATIAKDGQNINWAANNDEMTVATEFKAVFAQANAPFFKETFDACDGTGGNDGSWSGSIASNTTPESISSAWTLANDKAANACLKLGSGSNAKGSAQTPSFSLTGSATLTFKAGAWNGNSEGTTLNISATGATLKQNDETISSVTMEKGAWTTYTVDVTEATGTVTITFEAENASNNRFFLDEVEVKNGDAEYSNYRFAPSNVAAPVIVLEEGTYYGSQNVTITSEKQVFYSLDGNTWNEYTSAVTLNQAGTVTLSAKAYDSDAQDYSAVVSKSYTIVTEIANPTITASSVFVTSKTVEISHELIGTEGFALQYSYDGQNYTAYTEALTLTETATVYAKATIGSLEAIVSATYTKGNSVTYTKVTSADGLAAGMKFIIVSSKDNTYKAAGTRGGNSYLAAVDINAPIENTTITINEEAVNVFELRSGQTGWLIYSDEGYLVPNGNDITTKAKLSDTDEEWTFFGTKTIVRTGTNSNKYLQYNSSSPRFKTYSSQTDVDIYAIPFTTYTLTFKDADDNETSVKVVAGYEYTITNNNFGSEAPEGYEFTNKWTDGTKQYYVGAKIVMDGDKTLTPCLKIELTPNATLDEEDIAQNDLIVENGETVTLSLTEQSPTMGVIRVTNGKVIIENANSDETQNPVTLTSDSIDIDKNGVVEVKTAVTAPYFRFCAAPGQTSEAGELFGSNNISVAGDIYLDVQLDPTAVDASEWYGISAPFDVNIADGFFTTDGTQLVSNYHFQLWIYDPQKYSNGGRSWTRCTTGVMEANKAYLIGFDPSRFTTVPNVIRLKYAGTQLPSTVEELDIQQYSNGYGWNGVANPNFFNVNVNRPVQIFDNHSHNFLPAPVDETDYNFVATMPLFCQANGTGNEQISFVAATQGNTYEYNAPTRMIGERYSFRIQIRKPNSPYYDNQMYVRASEDALATFEEGKDMETLNETCSSSSAIIWTNAYGKHLAVEDAPLQNNQAIYNLTIMTPAAGTYVLRQANEVQGADLYVTYEGAIVWNLSLGDYEMDLVRGTTTGYGLLLVAQPNQMPTGVENGESLNGENGVQKILLNGQLYILRDGHLYDAVGKQAR